MKTANGKVLKMGCYHFNYYLDGKLIAVSVADLTPISFSTVYFFSDPAYKRFSLGVVSSINDIKYV